MGYGTFSNDRNEHRPNSETAVIAGYEDKTAESIMKCGLTTVQRDTLVYETIEIMAKKRLTSLPVVDDMNLVGIISEKDVMRLVYDRAFLSSTVEDFMTEQIVSFDKETSLTTICHCLIENHFRTVPIVYQGRLAGMISRADLIKASIDKFKPPGLGGQTSGQQRGLLGSDIMRGGLATVTEETPIFEAMQLLVEKNVTGLPVIDDTMNLTGIVTEKDMLKLFVDPTVTPGKTRDFMSRQVVSFEHDANLLDIFDCLLNHHFRSVPMLKQGKLVGVISRSEVIVALLKHKSIIFKQRRQST